MIFKFIILVAQKFSYRKNNCTKDNHQQNWNPHVVIKRKSVDIFCSRNRWPAENKSGAEKKLILYQKDKNKQLILKKIHEIQRLSCKKYVKTLNLFLHRKITEISQWNVMQMKHIGKKYDFTGVSAVCDSKECESRLSEG